jgi:streptogramin lyase
MLTWLSNYWRLQPRTPKQGRGKNRGRAKMPYQPRMELLEDRRLLSSGFQEFGGFSSGHPQDITTGPDGALWFTADYGDKIGRIATDGTITEFSVPGQVSLGYGIATGSDDNLWFADRHGFIWQLTAAGDFTAFAATSSPYVITTGPNGNVWFGEYDLATQSTKIGEIAPDGTLTEFDVPLTGFGQIIGGMTAGPDGNVWFTARDGYHREIDRITPTGTITEFSCTGVPDEITAGPDGNLWFLDKGSNSVGNISPDGAITEYHIPVGGLDFERGIAAGPDGNVWFTTDLPGSIDRITPDGTITQFAIPEQNADPRGIVTGPDGNLWFTDRMSNHIWQYNPTCAPRGAGAHKAMNPSPTDPNPGSPVVYPIDIVHNPVCARGGAGAHKAMNPSPTDPNPGSPVAYPYMPYNPVFHPGGAGASKPMNPRPSDPTPGSPVAHTNYFVYDPISNIVYDPNVSLPPFWNVGLDRHFTDAPHLTSAEPIDAVFGGADSGIPALTEIELQQPRLAEWPAQPFHGTDQLDGRSWQLLDEALRLVGA